MPKNYDYLLKELKNNQIQETNGEQGDNSRKNVSYFHENVSLQNAIGYCKNNTHRGYLSVGLMQQHQCLEKKCPYLEKYEKKAYWVRRDIKNVLRKINKKGKGIVLINGTKFATLSLDKLLSAAMSAVMDTGEKPVIEYDESYVINNSKRKGSYIAKPDVKSPSKTSLKHKGKNVRQISKMDEAAPYYVDSSYDDAPTAFSLALGKISDQLAQNEDIEDVVNLHSLASDNVIELILQEELDEEKSDE